MKYIIPLILFTFSINSIASAGTYFDSLNQDDQKVVVTNDITGDPIRQGSNNPAVGMGSLYYNGEIFSFLEAQNETLGFIQRMINYFLTMIGFIALIYLLYNGFLMVTAAGDDTQFKKGAKAARTATIAIIGIGLSALIVNFILYLIAQIL